MYMSKDSFTELMNDIDDLRSRSGQVWRMSLADFLWQVHCLWICHSCEPLVDSMMVLPVEAARPLMLTWLVNVDAPTLDNADSKTHRFHQCPQERQMAKSGGVILSIEKGVVKSVARWHDG